MYSEAAWQAIGCVVDVAKRRMGGKLDSGERG
jgi:hypothetical protein